MRIFLIALLLPLAAAHDDHAVTHDPAADLGLFPDYDEVEQAMRAATGQGFTLHELGVSQGGKMILMLEMNPFNQSTTTLLLTQQHGNEPAGTPAALQLLEELQSQGDAWELLRAQRLLLLPMINPDGATANDREAKNGTDINRDHVALTTPEAKMLHQVLVDFDVHVAIDHHEYSGMGIGEPVPVRTYDYDLTLLHPRHGNVAKTTMDASVQLMYDGIKPYVEAQGYSVGEYGMQTIAGQPFQQVAGGPDPGILRNNFGLNNVAGLLAESFVGSQLNPFIDQEYRQAVHYHTMMATLSYVADNSDIFVAAKSDAIAFNMAGGYAQYQETGLQGDIPLSYGLSTPVDEFLALHGIPVGINVGEQTLYATATPKSGLLSAIMHPDSSRNVFDAEGVDPGPFQSVQGADGQNAPVPVILVFLALAMALWRRP